MAYKTRLPTRPGHYVRLAVEGPLAAQAARIREEARRVAGTDDPWRDLAQAVEAYNRARRDLILARWRAAGMTWCTKGEHVRPAREVRLRYVDSYGIGGITDCMSHKEWFAFYRSLHQMCEECARKTEAPEREEVNYHGERGIVYTHVYPAERQRGVLRFLKDNAWLPVPDEARAVPEFRFDRYGMYEKKVFELEDEWGVPPELEVSRRRDLGPIVSVRRDPSVALFSAEA